MESQNHLIDIVDRGHITEEVRLEHNVMAEAALQEVTGLMEYLQSPDALRNARRARERRIENRAKREPRTENRANPEPRTENRRTPNPRTPNIEPRRANREPRSANREPNREAEDEPRSEHSEE
jgi:hypothetical protein